MSKCAQSQGAAQPFVECTSFDRCSAPKCPLDPGADRRDELAGEPQCVATRRTREAIAARYPELLPGGGLTKREIRRAARKAAFAALPEDAPRKLALARANAARSQEPRKSAPETTRGACGEAPGVET